MKVGNFSNYDGLSRKFAHENDKTESRETKSADVQPRKMSVTDIQVDADASSSTDSRVNIDSFSVAEVNSPEMEGSAHKPVDMNVCKT